MRTMEWKDGWTTAHTAGGEMKRDLSPMEKTLLANIESLKAAVEIEQDQNRLQAKRHQEEKVELLAALENLAELADAHFGDSIPAEKVWEIADDAIAKHKGEA